MKIKSTSKIKIVAWVLTFAIVLTLIPTVPLPAQAASDFFSDDWAFDSTTGTLTVTTNAGTTAWRTERTVAGADNFQLADVKSVEFGENITSIAANAFRNTGLTSVTIPNTVTSIGNSAFMDCADLTSVTLPDNPNFTTIGTDMFNGAGLTSIAIPSSVTTIYSTAFRATGLTSVTIPANVTTINTDAFVRCASLRTITFLSNTPPTLGGPGSLGGTGSSAVREVFVPVGMVSVYTDALFGYIPAIAEIYEIGTTTPTESWHFDSGTGTLTVYTNDGTTAWRTEVTPTDVKSVVFDGSVTAIGNDAFQGTGITSVTIPNTVTSIGNRAFMNCTNLTSATLSDNPNFTTIQVDTFYNTGLTSIIIPNSVTTIGMTAFHSTRLTSVTIPANVTSIGQAAFNNNVNLASVIFLRDTPPNFEPSPFGLVSGWADRLLYVPTGATAAYTPALGVSFHADTRIIEFPLSVTFDSKGGSTVDMIEGIDIGGTITVPADPARTGYTFDGWYKDEDLTEVWDFNSDIVIDHTILYARWISNILYTVTWNADGGTPEPTQISVAHGEKITAPIALTKDYYTFDGWYKDEVLTEPWNFDTDTATGNITLYAKWDFGIPWNGNAGSSTSPILTVQDGDTVVIEAGAFGTFTVPENVTVTITGGREDTPVINNRTLTFIIPATSRVVWKAYYTNDSAPTIAITESSAGVFEVADGRITGTRTSSNPTLINAYDSQVDIVVSGGELTPNA